MATPKVQKLPDILAGLESAYAPTRGLYNKQIAGVGEQTKSAKMGLDAKKVQGFNDINDQAASRGVSFGGIPLNEQANYLSTEYLPGMQRIEEGATQRTDALSLALAQLEQDKYKTGLGTQERQQAELNKYLETERARKAQLFLEEKRMNFERSENQANRAASSRANNPQMSPAQMRQGAIGFMEEYKGDDGFVSPEMYRQAKAYWVDSGGDPRVFDRDFKMYANKTHLWDYGYGKRPTSNSSVGKIDNFSQLRF